MVQNISHRDKGFHEYGNLPKSQQLSDGTDLMKNGTIQMKNGTN